MTTQDLLAASCIAIVAAFPSPWARAEFEGVVYEVSNPDAPRTEWRRRPLDNAYVSIAWSIAIPAPAHATTSCRHTEIARTDEKGQFVLDGPSFLASGLAHASAMAYASRRERVAFPYGGSRMSEKDITMAKSTIPAGHDRLQQANPQPAASAPRPE